MPEKDPTNYNWITYAWGPALAREMKVMLNKE